MSNQMVCQALVVGAGVGGCVTAKELCQRGLDTLLIDAGPLTPQNQLSLPMQTFWKNAGLTAALGRPNIFYAEGACVGGGSEINSGIIQRCPEALLEEWALRYHIDHFSPQILTPFYETAENLVHATLPSSLSPASLRLEQAATRLAWQGQVLKMAYQGEEKQSLSKVLLEPALHQGLKLLPHCQLQKIIFRGKRAIKAILAVQHDRQQIQKIEVSFDHLFLCTGAIQTPFLLLKHGVTQNIGRNLKMHPTIKALCQFPEPLHLANSLVPTYAITEFMPQMRIGGSVFTPSYFAMALAEDWQNRKHLLPHLFNCGIYYAMIKPEGCGRVFALPGFTDPIVRYSLTATDWKNLEIALYRLTQALFAAEAHSVIPSVLGHQGWSALPPGPAITLNRKTTSLMSIHLFSSCPMGENPKLSATNSFGQVHAYENLYINDASLLPDAPATNPQASIMAIALRNCEHFISIHGR